VPAGKERTGAGERERIQPVADKISLGGECEWEMIDMRSSQDCCIIDSVLLAGTRYIFLNTTSSERRAAEKRWQNEKKQRERERERRSDERAGGREEGSLRALNFHCHP
jgi:hypothetical protein